MHTESSIAPGTLPELFFDRVPPRGEGEALLFKKDGLWSPISWREYAQRVRELARGLADWIWPGDAVAILSENRPEWCFADLAVLSLGGVSVPIYPSNPPKDVEYILEDCDARLLFVSTAVQLDKIVRLRAEGRLGKLERVVLFDEPAPFAADWLVPLSAVRARGAAQPDPVDERLAEIGPDSLATILYTSGTTGSPKGVMLTHRNLVSNVLASHELIGGLELPVRRMLSFLPLAHAFERTCGFYVALEHGFTVAFAENVAKVPENLREIHPTVIISVPRVYEKMYARIQTGAASHPLRKRLFDWAVDVGKRHRAAELAGLEPGWLLGLERGVADALVFKKIRHLLGGELRYAVSGGAPLARELGEFFSAIGLMLFEGYGLTETSPILAANRPGAARFGSVGKPWPGVEIRIAPESGREGEGEVLARGPNIMTGYYHKPEATAEVLDPDGWLHTGDIGYLDADGFLHITDRKKDLIKTSGGKYVAPQPIESRLKLEPFVEQAIVLGDRRKYCVALIAPRRELLEAALGRALPAEREALNRDPEVRRLFEQLVERANHGVGSWEQIKRFYLLPAELSQESGELTPTLKVKRRVVEEKFRTVIDALYED